MADVVDEARAEALDAIKARIEYCRTYNFGMPNADRLAHDDAPALVGEVERLTAQLQAAQAEAWDEGWDAHENSGCEDMCGVCAVCLPDNPYRASIEQTEVDRG